MLCIIEHPSEAAAEPVPAGIADKRGFLVPTAEFLLVLRAVRIAATTRRLALTFPTEAALPAFRNLRACIMADTAVAFRGGYQFPVCFDLTAYSRAILANIFCNLRNLQPCCNPAWIASLSSNVRCLLFMYSSNLKAGHEALYPNDIQTTKL